MAGNEARTTDWPAAWAKVRALYDADDDAADTENDRLDALWKAEYRNAFIKCALGRPGWDRENAEAWCDDIIADALASCRGGDCAPAEVAEVDVDHCEWESANAC